MRKNDNTDKTNFNKDNSGILSFVLILFFSVITFILFTAVFLFINSAVSSLEDSGKGSYALGNGLKNFFYIKNGSMYSGELNNKNVMLKNEFSYVRKVALDGGEYYYYPLEGRGTAAYYVSKDGGALCAIDKENRLFVNEYKSTRDFSRPRMVLLLRDEVDIKNRDNIKITDDGLYVYIRNINGVLYCYDRKNAILNTVDYEVSRMELQNGGNGAVYVSNRGVIKFYDLKRDAVVPSVVWYEKENAVAFHKNRIYYFYNNTLNSYDIESFEGLECGGILSSSGKLRFSRTEYFEDEMYVYLTRLGKKNIDEGYRADGNGNLEYIGSRADGHLSRKVKDEYVHLKDGKLEYNRDDVQSGIIAENVEKFVAGDNGRVIFFKRNRVNRGLYDMYFFDFIDMEPVIVEQGIKQVLLPKTIE